MSVRLPLEKFLATLLPLSLLWVFVACVSLCASESSHIPSERIISGSMDVRNVPDCDGCPLNSFPKAAAPEHVNPEVATTNFAPAIPSVSYSDSDILNGSLRGPLCTASPPLERLPGRRI